MSLFAKIRTYQPTSDLSVWIDRGVLVAVVLACGVALSLNVADPDLWGHVQYGRDALAHGVSATTTYSYIAEGYPWINHEIFAEYLLAIGADWLGGVGMLIVKCLLGLAIVGTIMARAWRGGATLIPVCATGLVIALALGNHWSLRPQLISYMSFTLLLALLSYAFEGWEGKWQYPLRLPAWLRERLPENVTAKIAPFERETFEPLTYSLPRLKLLWLVPLLMVVWTNSHGGFLAGLCVYWAYLALRGVEALVHKGRAADGLLLRFALMGAAAGLATFLNPYSFQFHGWLYQDLAVPRPEIVEWRSPALFDLQFMPFWILAASSIAAVIFSKKPRDLTQLVILSLILWQALAHQRHIAFFAIACGWWLAPHFDSALRRFGVGERLKTKEEMRYGWIPTEHGEGTFGAFSPPIQTGIAVMLAAAICICSGKLAARLGALKVERDRYPLAAAEFIARHKLTGKMVCTFNWAQYALAAFGPKEPGQPGILVQIDGRCRTAYSQAMLDHHFDFLMGEIRPDLRYRDPQSGPLDPTRVLRDGRPDLVLISRQQEPSAQLMAEKEKEGEWVLLYQDSLAQLYGRASKYDDPTSAYHLPLGKRYIGESHQHGWVYWPALPKYEPLAKPETPPSSTLSGTPQRAFPTDL
jgi:hypothetical protein